MGRQTHMWMQIVTNRPQPVNNKLRHTSTCPCLCAGCVYVCARVHVCVRAALFAFLAGDKAEKEFLMIYCVFFLPESTCPPLCFPLPIVS